MLSVSQMKDAESNFQLHSGAASKDSMDVPVENFRNIKIYSHLNFLLIGLSTGEIQVHVFGLFCCGLIDLKEHLPPNSECVILSADITENLKSLVAVLNVKCGNAASLQCVIIDASKLFKKAQDLYTISFKRGTILNTLSSIQRSMVNIIEAHEHIVIQEMQMQIFGYFKDKEPGTLSAQFMELLLYGSHSDELATFLRSELPEKRLKKIGSSIEVSHSNILKQIIYHLRPGIEKLLFELSTMLGLSRLSQIFSDSKINIEEELVYKCMVAAGACSMKANKVLHILEDSLIKYKAFFRWLTAAAAIVTNERIGNSPFDLNSKEMNFIFEYLVEIDSDTPISEKDELGQYLADKDITLRGDENQKNQWRKFLVENPCLEEFELIMPRFFDNKSLVQAHKVLTERAELIFQNFTDYIQQSFPVTYKCDLFSSEAKVIKKLSVIEEPKTHKVLIAFIMPQQEENLLQIVEIPHTGKHTDPPRIASVYFSENEVGKFDLIDLQFYSSEIISLLLEKSDCMHSFYVQLPIENVQNYFNAGPQNIFTIIDKDCLKMIENMKSLKFAVSGPRKVSVIVAEDGHRVRIFEMEADDEEDTAMSSNNVSAEETSGTTKLGTGEFSVEDFNSSNFSERINMADDLDDQVRTENGIIDFGDIDVNSLSVLSDFTDIEDLMERDFSSLDIDLERTIAGLAITPCSQSSMISNVNSSFSCNKKDLTSNSSVSMDES